MTISLSQRPEARSTRRRPHVSRAPYSIGRVEPLHTAAPPYCAPCPDRQALDQHPVGRAADRIGANHPDRRRPRTAWDFMTSPWLLDTVRICAVFSLVSFRRQLAKPLSVIPGKLTQVPETPFVGDISNFD